MLPVMLHRRNNFKPHSLCLLRRMASPIMKFCFSHTTYTCIKILNRMETVGYIHNYRMANKVDMRLHDKISQVLHQQRNTSSRQPERRSETTSLF